MGKCGGHPEGEGTAMIMLAKIQPMMAKNFGYSKPDAFNSATFCKTTPNTLNWSLVLLSDPSTIGTGPNGPDQNTSCVPGKER